MREPLYASIDELGAAAAMNKEDEVPEELLTPKEIPVPESSSSFEINFSWLMKETGPGEIEDYMDHPMNFNGTKAIAQAVRGFAGFFGDGGKLRLAILDVAFGLNRFRKGEA